MVADRGQLLLVGAILFSVVVVGIVVQLNDLQYTDSTASDAETDAIDRAAQTEAETRDALTGLANRVRNDTDRSKFGDALRENVSTYQNTSLNMTAAGGATYTNVTVNETASVNESVVRQNNDNEEYRPQNPPNPPDWTLITDADTVPEFWLNQSTYTGGVGTQFVVLISNPAGQEWRLKLQKVNVPGGPDDVEILVETPTSSNPVCTRSDGSDIEINPTGGSVEGHPVSCSFTPFTAAFDGPYTIKFEGGNNVKGSYKIGVINGSVEQNNFNPANVDQRLYYPAIDYQYRSPSTAYNRTFVVGGGGS